MPVVEHPLPAALMAPCSSDEFLDQHFPSRAHASLNELPDLGVQPQFLRLLWYPELAPGALRA